MPSGPTPAPWLGSWPSPFPSPRRRQGGGDCVHGAVGLTLASQVGMVTSPLPLAELNLTPSCPLATLLGPESRLSREPLLVRMFWVSLYHPLQMLAF